MTTIPNNTVRLLLYIGGWLFITVIEHSNGTSSLWPASLAYFSVDGNPYAFCHVGDEKK